MTHIHTALLPHSLLGKKQASEKREDTLAHLAKCDDYVSSVAAHGAPDDGLYGPIHRPGGERGEGGGFCQRGDIVMAKVFQPGCRPRDRIPTNFS